MRLFEKNREIKALNKKRKKAKAELAREKPTDAEQLAEGLRGFLNDCIESGIELDETQMRRMIEITDQFLKNKNKYLKT